MFFGILVFCVSLLINFLISKQRGISPHLFFCVNFSFSYMLFRASSFIDTRLSTQTYILFAASIAFFLLGIALSVMVKPNTDSKQLRLLSDAGITESSHDRIITTIYVLFMIGSLYSVFYYISHLGFLNYLHSIVSISAKDIQPEFTLMLYLKKLGQVLSIYTVFCLMKYKTHRKKYIVIIASLLFFNLGYQRNELFYILSLGIITALYTYSTNDNHKKTNKHSLSKTIIMSVVLIGALLFFLRTQEEFGKAFKIGGTLFGRELSGAILTPITYYTGPFASTSKYLSMEIDTPFLAYTGRFVYELLNAIGLVNTSSFNYGVPFVSIPFSFNTATMQYYLYSEGGYIWLCTFYLIVGFLSYRWYKEFLENRSILPLIKLVYISFLLLFSIREYALMRIDYLIVILAYEFIKHKRRVKFK